jgi:hypothetical protein
VEGAHTAAAEKQSSREIAGTTTSNAHVHEYHSELIEFECINMVWIVASV